MSQPAAAAPAAPVVQMIPLASIHESKSNPRKTFSGIEQLAEDVKVRGLLQPVLVRAGTNGNGDYELVFGARRYRAAKLAKLPALPAFVRELTDEQTLELQIVENTQRADVHPLEEADGYRRLHEEFKYSVEEIAAKVGKSRSAVYERIKLCALVPAAREAFFGGKLSASTALLVARIPDKELQAKAVKDLVGRAGDDPMSYRDAVDHVQRNYMLQLKDAPFSTTDATLVAKAGACSACPKRTGNQRELFADVKSPDVCTDPVCYREKVDALWDLKVSEAKVAGDGHRIIDDKKAKQLFKYGGLDHSSGYVDVASETWVGDKSVPIKTLLKKSAAPMASAPLLARDEHGRIHELVERRVVDDVVKELKPKEHKEYKPSKAELASNEKFRRERERDHKARKAEDAISSVVLAAVVSKAERDDLKPAAWKFLAACIGHRDNYDFLEDLAFRRGWLKEEDDGSQSADKVIAAEVGKLDANAARGFVVEAIAVSFNGYYGAERIDRLKLAAPVFGVDYDKLAAAATGKKSRAAKAKKATAKKRPGKKK